MKLTVTEIEDCVRYVYCGLVQEGRIHLPESSIQQLISDYKAQSRISLPLEPHEKAIVTLAEPKSAALFADRVWSVGYVGNQHEDINLTFGWEVAYDVRLRALFDLGVLEAEADGTMHEITNAPPASPNFTKWLGSVSQDLAAQYRIRGANVSPLYDSAAARDAEYARGDRAVLLAIADGVMVVDENALTWDQVRQFRQDSEARASYRRFVHWLDREMVGKSATFVADEISSREERYKWALRKHGIDTVVGALERAIAPSTLASASAAAAAIQFVMNQPLWSLLAAGGLALGSGAISLAKVALAHEDIKHANQEISYVQEVKRRFQPREA